MNVKPWDFKCPGIECLRCQPPPLQCLFLKQVEAWRVVAQAPHSADLELPHLFSILAVTPRTATPARALVAMQIPGLWPYIKMHQMIRGC